MDEVTKIVPAGWYDDPTSQGVQRWWDGVAWSDHRAPKPVAAPMVAVYGRRAYKTSHGFHLIMSIFTLGLWLPVWLIVGVYNAAKA